MPGQLSMASSTPSTSASSSTVEQLSSSGCRTPVWQKPPGQLALELHEMAGLLLQIWTTVTPSQSPSQTSPSASWSTLCWLPFDTRAQLSLAPDSPSPSRSVAQRKPWYRLVSHTGSAPAVQSAADRQDVPAGTPPYWQVPAWSGLYTSGQSSELLSTPSLSTSSYSQASPTPSALASSWPGL